MTDPSTSPSHENSTLSDAPSVLDRIIRTLTLALLVAAICSLVLYPLHWALNLTVHMQAHLLVAAILLGLMHAVRANRSWVAVCVMLAIGLSLSVRPWDFWRAPSRAVNAHPAQEKHALRILFWNVHYDGVDGDTLTEMAKQHDVDVVALLELSGRLRMELDELRSDYPVHEEIPRSDSFGIGLYSRIPGVIARRRLSDAVDVMILRTAPDDGPWVDIWAAHTYPPVGQAMYGARNAQIFELAQRVAEDRSVPQIVGGDFNTTPWSLEFRGFLQLTGLRDSSRGFGYQATWPNYLGPLGIPIDHVAVDQRLHVVSRRVVRVSGASDHAAILITLESGVPAASGS